MRLPASEGGTKVDFALQQLTWLTRAEEIAKPDRRRPAFRLLKPGLRNWPRRRLPPVLAFLESLCSDNREAVSVRGAGASRDEWTLFAGGVGGAARLAGFQGVAGVRGGWVGQQLAGTPAVFRPVRADFGFHPCHVLSYVFAAAQAGRPFGAGWAVYRDWIQKVWQGEVTAVIGAVQARLVELGEPTADEPSTSPRQIVQRTLTYLQNHQEQMAFARYRQEGLPLTSSLMESMVKQVNQRVKGTE